MKYLSSLYLFVIVVWGGCVRSNAFITNANRKMRYFLKNSWYQYPESFTIRCCVLKSTYTIPKRGW